MTAPSSGWVPRVFVSYAHDSVQHKEMVRQFCLVLRDGCALDVRLDQWDEGARRDWSLWVMDNGITGPLAVSAARSWYSVRCRRSC